MTTLFTQFYRFQEKDLAKRWENVNYRDFLRFNNMYITLEQYQVSQ